MPDDVRLKAVCALWDSFNRRISEEEVYSALSAAVDHETSQIVLKILKSNGVL